MTFDDKKLEGFFDDVVRCLVHRNLSVHSPIDECFKGECRRWGNRCIWERVPDLVMTFWKTAPDVDEDWKRHARGFWLNPDDFHDLMLGVFIGSDRIADPRVNDPRMYTRELTDEEAQRMYTKRGHEGVS